MVHTVDEYLNTLEDPARQWVGEYVAFMRESIPCVTEGITYEIPTYQTRYGCVAFSASGQHFSFHTFNESWLRHLKTQLPAARVGKGSLKIPYGCEEEAKPLLHEACRGILQASVPLTEKRKAI